MSPSTSTLLLQPLPPPLLVDARLDCRTKVEVAPGATHQLGRQRRPGGDYPLRFERVSRHAVTLRCQRNGDTTRCTAVAVAAPKVASILHLPIGGERRILVDAGTVLVAAEVPLRRGDQLHLQVPSGSAVQVARHADGTAREPRQEWRLHACAYGVASTEPKLVLLPLPWWASEDARVPLQLQPGESWSGGRMSDSAVRDPRISRRAAKLVCGEAGATVAALSQNPLVHVVASSGGAPAERRMLVAGDRAELHEGDEVRAVAVSRA
jgi:hypothetical protein